MPGKLLQSSTDAANAFTRRQFLAWMGIGATAVAASPLLSACASGSGAVTTPDVKSLQFGFPQMPSNISNLVLGVQGKHYPLQAHTVATRQAFAQSHPLGSQMDTSKLTHYVDNVEMPGNAPVEFMVWGTDSKAAAAGIPVSKPVPGAGDAFGQFPGSVYVAGGLNVPSWALKNVLDAASQVKPLNETYANDQRLAAWGIKNAPNSAEEISALFDLHYVPLSVAQKMVFKSPGVANISSQGSAIVLSIIGSNGELTGLTDAVTWFHNNTGVYGLTEAQIADATGTPAYVSATAGPGNGAPQANVFNPFIADGTVYLKHKIPPARTTAFREALRSATLSVANQCQDATSLERPSSPPPTGEPTNGPVTNYDGGNWVVSNGATPQTIDAQTAHDMAVKLGATPSSSASPAPAQATWTLSPTGFHQNLKVELNGDPQPIPTSQGGGTSIPLRIYNNNEKYYVACQQAFQGNTQLSAGSNNFASNDYTATIGTATTVMTVLGVPIFDTNWDDVSFQLPQSATHGRLVMVGAGSGTSWKQFFKDPQGNQLYSGCQIPGECSTPTIFTTIMNLAIPFVMLAADAGGYGAVSKVGAKQVAKNGTTISTALKAVLTTFRQADGLSGIVNTLLAVPAIQGDLSNWGSTSPAQWAIPFAKILMVTLAKGLAAVATALIAAETAARIADAIPIVGEVYAVLSLAADTAALTTATVEVTNQPMASPFQISAAYTPTITIQKDPRDSVFPRTATTWTLTPQIEGDSVLTAVRNTSFSWQDTNINAQGQFQQAVPSIPVGSRIRWTVSFEAANGFPVGVGATDWLDNSDIQNLPQPTIIIRELEYPLTSESTFDLNATTQYTTGTGYSWSDQSSIGGTVQDQTTVTGKTALPAAGSLAVGTITGCVGYAYQTDQGWLINQVAATSQPNEYAASMGRFFATQPHLAYDSMGTVPTGGANYLLEPWSKINGYLVRQLDLAQGDFGYKPVESDSITTHGRFYGEVHGVTFHPAGYLMAWNSDTCRIQTLRLPKSPSSLSATPTDDELFDVPTADWFAGKGNSQGTRPGLVQQPVGIAMGLNGIVLVLEQGTQRIQAFNTSGSPTPYFTADIPATQTPGGGQAGYYLDLSQTIPGVNYSGIGVDGAGYVYVHGYQGDGSQASDYGLTVFDKTGKNVIPFTTGINAATFNVDYWRNLYTQDFVPVQLTSGGTYLGKKSGVAEPAMSIWIPNTPNPSQTPSPTATSPSASASASASGSGSVSTHAPSVMAPSPSASNPIPSPSRSLRSPVATPSRTR